MLSPDFICRLCPGNPPRLHMAVVPQSHVAQQRLEWEGSDSLLRDAAWRVLRWSARDPLLGTCPVEGHGRSHRALDATLLGAPAQQTVRAQPTVHPRVGKQRAARPYGITASEGRTCDTGSCTDKPRRGCVEGKHKHCLSGLTQDRPIQAHRRGFQRAGLGEGHGRTG